MDRQQHTVAGVGTWDWVPTGTGVKIRNGGLSFGTAESEPATPVAGQIIGVTLVSPVIQNPTYSTLTPATVTASTVTLGAAHANRVTTLNRAAGIAVTLPAATGSGDRYDLVVLATFTAAASIAVADATDYMIGVAQLGIDGGTFVPHQYPTANTGTLATESDTIALFGGASNTAGGIKGARISLIDIATDIWSVLYISDAGGTEVNPFSAAV